MADDGAADGSIHSCASVSAQCHTSASSQSHDGAAQRHNDFEDEATESCPLPVREYIEVGTSYLPELYGKLK